MYPIIYTIFSLYPIKYYSACILSYTIQHVSYHILFSMYPNIYYSACILSYTIHIMYSIMLYSMYVSMYPIMPFSMLVITPFNTYTIQHVFHHDTL